MSVGRCSAELRFIVTTGLDMEPPGAAGIAGQ
jgi:hypothetical protein